MKVCRLCSERYRDHVDFCFQDGEVLVAESAVGAAAPYDDLDAPPPPKRPAGQADSAPPRPQPAPAQPRPQSQVPSAPEADPVEAGPARPTARSMGASRVPERDDPPLTAAEQVTIPLPNPGARAPVSTRPVRSAERPTEPIGSNPPAADERRSNLPSPSNPPSADARRPAPQVQQRRGPQPEAAEAADTEPQDGRRRLPVLLLGLGVLAVVGLVVGGVAMFGGAAAIIGAGGEPEGASMATAAPEPAVVAPLPEPDPVPEPAAVEPVPVEPVVEPAPVVPAPIAVAPVPAPAPAPTPVVAPAPAPVVAPAPATPASGIVSFTSVPPGAELRVDDRSVGRTPAKIDLPAGPHRVTVALQGFQTWSGSVDVKGAKQEVPVVKLVPAGPAPAPAAADAIPARKGRVYLAYAEPGAKVWVDGEFKGTLPLMLEMAGGAHEFKIESAGGAVTTVTRTVVLKEQGNTPVFLDKN